MKYATPFTLLIAVVFAAPVRSPPLLNASGATATQASICDYLPKWPGCP